mgnify:CR=1 FL=1
MNTSKGLLHFIHIKYIFTDCSWFFFLSKVSLHVYSIIEWKLPQGSLFKIFWKYILKLKLLLSGIQCTCTRYIIIGCLHVKIVCNFAPRHFHDIQSTFDRLVLINVNLKTGHDSHKMFKFNDVIFQ